MLGPAVSFGGGGILSPHLPKATEENFIQSIMMGANVPPHMQQQPGSPYNAQYHCNNNFSSQNSFSGLHQSAININNLNQQNKEPTQMPSEIDYTHQSSVECQEDVNALSFWGVYNNGSATSQPATSTQTRHLDREYMWEAPDEQMYDDIVASTQPLNYNPALILQKFNYGAATGGYLSRGSSIPGFFNTD